ncbi:MAG TPA: MFS transporter, partial [Candidatus Polarisedimenticolia bacterium]|nr:MFS transporter [Candidatus Polarisedimenticolia bacterium]
LLALRILLGLFSGFGTMSVALVTHGCPRQRIGKAVGTLQATQILSTAVGPFVGGILAHAIGIRNTFLVTFALCSLAFFLVSVLYRDTVPDLTDPETGPVVVSPAGPVSEGVRAVLPRPAGAGRMDDRGPSFRRLLALPLFLPLLPILFFDNVVDRSLGLIVPLFVADLTGRGSAVAITGMVVSAGTFASAASAYLLGHGTGRIPPLQLLLWSLLGGSLSIAAMAFCRSIPSFAVLRVLLGLAVGGAATLSYTIGGAVLPGALRVSGYAFLSSVAMLGGAMGPILSGLIASHDLRAPLVVGGVLYAGMTLHVAILARRSGRFSGALAAMGGEASLPVPPAQEEP